MSNPKLENKIISLIPSKTIKDEVKRIKHKFSDIELVQIITQFAPTWEEMIDLLLEINKTITDNKIKKYIHEFIKIEKKKYQMLVTSEEGYVYDVIMDPDMKNEIYLVPDFESAFTTIDSFLKYYKKYIKKNEYSLYKIVKRKISKRIKPREIDKDENPVSCSVNNKRQIIRIYSNLNYVNLDKIDLKLNGIKYPDIFKPGDLIFIDILKYPNLKPWRYYNYYYRIENNRMYGINSFANYSTSEDDVECCFLKLSSEYVIYKKIEKDDRGYCDYLMCHSHYDFGYIEKADLDNIPNKIKEDYLYAVNQLIKLKCIGR